MISRTWYNFSAVLRQHLLLGSAWELVAPCGTDDAHISLTATHSVLQHEMCLLIGSFPPHNTKDNLIINCVILLSSESACWTLRLATWSALWSGSIKHIPYLCAAAWAIFVPWSHVCINDKVFIRFLWNQGIPGEQGRKTLLVLCSQSPGLGFGLLTAKLYLCGWLKRDWFRVLIQCFGEMKWLYVLYHHYFKSCSFYVVVADNKYFINMSILEILHFLFAFFHLIFHKCRTRLLLALQGKDKGKAYPHPFLCSAVTVDLVFPLQERLLLASALG